MALSLHQNGVENADGILYLAFNQDNECFCVGAESGFFIYNCHPFQALFCRRFPGGLGIVELLHRSNIVALVGGGRKPCWPPDRVQIWDDSRVQIARTLIFDDPVQAVKLRRGRVFIATASHVHVFEGDEFKPAQKFSTAPNLAGAVDATVRQHSDCVLAAPSLRPGVLRIENITDGVGTFVTVGEAAPSAMKLSQDGALLAVASEDSRKICVYECCSNKLVKELRCGAASPISSLSFNSDSTLLVACTIGGTVHIYNLADESSAGLYTGVSRWLSGDDSFAWYTHEKLRIVCVFGLHDVVYALDTQSSFLELRFNRERGGACSSESRMAVSTG
eukprot:TRINITY_DN39287_c0_g1_i1.p1 TRINITY_DN39287_c0_g1~~TRINITY_DN39287_c0_g1_i1.p1  ORF type:complete len:334 (+),score=53.74 TRINITY_DN39287_c0_g1_i1:43-1044(+)